MRPPVELVSYASAAHYAEHLQPIVAELERRGRPVARWAARSSQPWGNPPPPARRPPRAICVAMVASYVDARKMVQRGARYIYVEHGAGQTYLGDPAVPPSPSYSGGPEHDRCLLFVAPSEHVAQRWRAAYPGTPVAVVGCPWLDRWHLQAAGEVDDGEQQQHDEQHHQHGGVGVDLHGGGSTPTVAVTFHWECSLVPETFSAWRHYDAALPALAERYRVLGHGHPRAWGKLARRWAQLGVEATPHLADVLDRADLLVADNTSAAYEFASLGRPVLMLNAPWYRRDVHHGLRFWSHVPGLQVDEPDQLVAGVGRALADPPEAQALRARAVGYTYSHCDGRAASRAADAIQEVLDHA